MRGARIQKVKTTSTLKICRTINSRCGGKSQARKSYCREWFLLPAELIFPWIHDGRKSHSLWGGQRLRIPR